jgi:predicted RNA-binding Zn ribbon-like protein
MSLGPYRDRTGRLVRSQMNFTHYSDEAAALAADLVNTRAWESGKEFMTDAGYIQGFLEEHEMASDWSVKEQDVDSVRKVRDRLRKAFEVESEEECVRTLNDLLDRAGARPRVTNHDGSWHLHYVPARASLADHLAVTAAMGVASVISHFGFDRLGICAADDCLDAFVDTSRNKSRRYCADTCSSRMNVAAYRSRHKHSADKS